MQQGKEFANISEREVEIIRRALNIPAEKITFTRGHKGPHYATILCKKTRNRASFFKFLQNLSDKNGRCKNHWENMGYFPLDDYPTCL